MCPPPSRAQAACSGSLLPGPLRVGKCKDRAGPTRGVTPGAPKFPKSQTRPAPLAHLRPPSARPPRRYHRGHCRRGGPRRAVPPRRPARGEPRRAAPPTHGFTYTYIFIYRFIHFWFQRFTSSRTSCRCPNRCPRRFPPPWPYACWGSGGADEPCARLRAACCCPGASGDTGDTEMRPRGHSGTPLGYGTDPWDTV